MLFYLFVLFIILLIGISYRDQKSNKGLLFMLVLIGLVMGLRNSSIGTDTFAYCSEFYDVKWLSLSDIFKNVGGFGDANLLYTLFLKAISLVSPNDYTVFLMCVSAVISVALYRFIRKFSENYLMSIVIAVSLGFVFFFMTGIKQTLAMAAVLTSFINLWDKKYFKFFLWIIIAALFHNTAIIALLALPATKLKSKKMYLLLVPILVVGTIVYQSQIVEIMKNLLPEGKYSVYGSDRYSSSNNYTGLVIQLFCFLISFVLLWNNKERERPRFLFGIYTVGLLFQCLTPIIAEFFRISMYFSITSVVMLPYAFEKTTLISSKDKPLVRFIAGTVFVLYFVISNFHNSSFIPYITFLS